MTTTTAQSQTESDQSLPSQSSPVMTRTATFTINTIDGEATVTQGTRGDCRLPATAMQDSFAVGVVKGQARLHQGYTSDNVALCDLAFRLQEAPSAQRAAQEVIKNIAKFARRPPSPEDTDTEGC